MRREASQQAVCREMPAKTCAKIPGTRGIRCRRSGGATPADCCANAIEADVLSGDERCAITSPGLVTKKKSSLRCDSNVEMGSVQQYRCAGHGYTITELGCSSTKISST